MMGAARTGRECSTNVDIATRPKLRASSAYDGAIPTEATSTLPMAGPANPALWDARTPMLIADGIDAVGTNVGISTYPAGIAIPPNSAESPVRPYIQTKEMLPIAVSPANALATGMNANCEMIRIWRWS